MRFGARSLSKGRMHAGWIIASIIRYLRSISTRDDVVLKSNEQTNIAT